MYKTTPKHRKIRYIPQKELILRERKICKKHIFEDIDDFIYGKRENVPSNR